MLAGRALAAFTPVPYDPPFGTLPKPLPAMDVAGVLLVGDYVVLPLLLVAVAAVVARYRRSGAWPAHSCAGSRSPRSSSRRRGWALDGTSTLLI